MGAAKSARVGLRQSRERRRSRRRSRQTGVARRVDRCAGARRAAATRPASASATRDARFEEYVPAAHQIERRQQVMVEPALREDDREQDESDAGQCDEHFRQSRVAATSSTVSGQPMKETSTVSAKTMLDVEAADVCWLPIGAVGSTASTSAQVGVERSRSARPQAADLRRRRNRRRSRYPARVRSHARSVAAPALPRARDRRAASRRAVPRAWRGTAPAARPARRRTLFAAIRYLADTDSTTSSSKTRAIRGCSRFSTSRKRLRPDALRSTRIASTMTRRRARSSRKSCATKCFT